MHDAITATKAGIAATAIITDRFIQTAQAIAQVTGMPMHPFAVIPHPISNNSDAVLQEKAAIAVAQCVTIFLQQ